ncbi:elongator complex protein 2 [Leptinotarsa decemlineata]|uniref:elongator complex protein 2 n=1 Tax=Leptinotarsa decemlineata TaxID=7539 RepID=UPI000C254EED|nr:probable elongator complex protein 2 [Leptinotarsa decemlineata]
MKITNCYTSCNSNQTPTIAHWGRNNLICYGACNSVIIYDPDYGSGGKIIDTLVGHSKRVNSVKWLGGRNVSFETELLSASADSIVCVWSSNGKVYSKVSLVGHSSNVNIVDGLYKENNSTVVVSISMDCCIKIWWRRNATDKFICSQTVNLGYNISVGIKLSFLPDTDEILLACALDNSKIQLYVETSDADFKMESSCQLAGHEDWVRGLDFTVDGADLLLASSSQDNFIRLWRISSQLVSKVHFETTEKAQIKSRSKIFNVHLESILTGHEGWVYSVNWNPKSLQLLSSSIDKSMIIWELDTGSDVWQEKLRVGEVGGNTLGFYGGVFSPKGDKILAHSYRGAFHIWRDSNQSEGWIPCVTVGGHFSEVVDCAWEPKGEFLISVGSDQTTRIHGPWRKGDEEVTWHEIARPQIHGYDMTSVAVLSRYKFASSAEEKIIRTFDAPTNFAENFHRICGINEDEELDSLIKSECMRPKGASVPSLGLSNKAVHTEDNIELTIPLDKKNPYPEESHFTATDLIEPPTEETLMQNTLWPETMKLYGHGYEVFCLAASPDGKYLASACKSTQPQHAAILLWNTSNWKLITKLMSHSLTVVQLQFSPNSQHLLSVSRDRRWSIFSKNEDCEFTLAATTDKKTAIHSRIIWTCSWSHDSKYFATGARDGKVIIWTINRGKEKTSVLGEWENSGKPLEFKNESVTAVSFAPTLVSEKYLIAIGFETGIIHLFGWCQQEWNKILILSDSMAHHLTVKKLVFRPVLGRTGYKNCDDNVLQLASCSSDTCVKIFNIYIDKV